MFYTYIILNTFTSKRYVGKTDDISQRWRAHKSIAFNEKAEGYKYPFYCSIRKYSLTPEDIDKVFIIESVEEYESEFDAFAREIFLIDFHETNVRKHGADARGYNQTDGGEGSKGHKWSLESRQRFSERTKGRIISEEAKKKISEASRGRKHTDETKKRLSVSKIGANNPSYGREVSEETRQKLSKANKGKPKKPFTEEAKRESSEARKGKPGRPHTEVTKQKLSEARRGENGSNAKLTWDVVDQIRSEYSPGKMGYIKLSKKYEVAVSTIVHIIKNETWRKESE